jgi:O-antigen/teichoic acid export membrane protein
VNARQILSGLGWSTFATAVSAACQIVFMAVLARILDPAAFGLMAMAAIALRFAGYFSQLGFAQALIQRPLLAPEDTTAALVMATALGSVLYGVMMLAAPLFAAAFRTPELPGLIDVLGVSLLLSPLASLPLALLRREARFKRVNAIEVFAYVAGYGGVGIACAVRGLGVWSLVASTLTQQMLLLALGALALRYPLCWPVPRAAYVRLWTFGSRYSLIGFIEFLGGNVETLFIGRLLGKTDLGLFNRAGTLTNLPVELGVNAVNKVLFPALAGMQGDRSRMADGFEMLLLSVGLFSTAMACGIAAAAPDVIGLLLGSRWAGIAPLVAILALAVPPTFMFVACGVTLDSLAALGPKLRMQSLMLVVKVALLFALMRWQLQGAAWAVLITEALRLVLGLRLVGRLLDIPARRLGRLLLLSAAVGATVWCTVAAMRALATAAALPLLARVPLESLADAAMLAASLLLLAVCCPHYLPLQRFATVRRWHGRLLSALHARAVLP